MKPNSGHHRSTRANKRAQEKEDCDLNLHFINALFAHLTGHDLYLAAQIKDAIRFSLEELETKPADTHTALRDAATRLLTTTFGQHFPQRGFYHWDAAQTLASATPLFARDEILNGLKTLAPYRDSTLLITNLRPALVPPPPRRPTAQRLRDYEELIDFIRHLSAAHTAPNSQLQLLFL